MDLIGLWFRARVCIKCLGVCLGFCQRQVEWAFMYWWYMAEVWSSDTLTGTLIFEFRVCFSHSTKIIGLQTKVQVGYSYTTLGKLRNYWKFPFVEPLLGSTPNLNPKSQALNPDYASYTLVVSILGYPEPRSKP